MFEVTMENSLFVIKSGKQYLTQEYELSSFAFSAATFRTREAAQQFLDKMSGSGSSGSSGALHIRLNQSDEAFDRIGNRRTAKDDEELVTDRDRSFRLGKKWREEKGKKTTW